MPFDASNVNLSKSAGARRLMKEASELRSPTEMYFTQPLEDNLFEWHFTIRGPEGTEFAGGIYHGRLMFPTEYPMKPPNIFMLTPNGRFETNKKICLSISGYHPETWLPSWSIRTALLAIIGFLPTPGSGAVGALDYPKEEREKLAKKSNDWKCSECGACMAGMLLPVTADSLKNVDEEAQKLASQIRLTDGTSAAVVDGSASSSAPSVNTTIVAGADPNAVVDGAAATTAPPLPETQPAAAAVQTNIQPPQRTVNRVGQRQGVTNDWDMYSLFLYIPMGILLAGIFVILFLRRFSGAHNVI